MRGQLRIEEQENPGSWGCSAADGVLPAPAEAGRRRLQRRHGTARSPVYSGIFVGDSEVVPLSELKNEFYRKLPGIRDAILRRTARANGFYRSRPDKVRQNWIGAAVGVRLVVARRRHLPLEVDQASHQYPFVAAGILSAIILLHFAARSCRRSHRGRSARLWSTSSALRSSLRRVESENLKRIIIGHPELFDKYLPFAMAFGVEKQFARAFAGICTDRAAAGTSDRAP